MALLSFENLSFSYPEASVRALDGVSLDIEQGEFVLLCGPRGCGKTTLLRHAKSVLSPHGVRGGRVLLEGVSLESVEVSKQAARIGFVMQDPDAQLVTDKVWHELAFGLENLGVEESAMRLRVAEMASYFGIESWFNREVRELSGGQKQLLNLASVMAMHPDILVLDEPTSQLDPMAAAEFLSTVRRLNLELGTTVLMTEHRLEGLFDLADRVVVMGAGRVLVDGDPRNVGQILHADGDGMRHALPTPMRVYFDVMSENASDASVPIGVREGRMWLTSFVGEKPAGGRLAFDGDLVEPGAQKGAEGKGPEGRGAANEIITRKGSAGRAAAEEWALELKDVWLRYDRTLPDVLKGLSLRVRKGSVHAIVGGNGVGKSTLLKAVAGVVKPYRGTIRILGEKVVGRRSRELFRGALALLPQDPKSLFVKDSVRDELAEMLEDSSFSKQEIDECLHAVGERVGVANLMDAHPLDLSGGEQQLVAFAKVLLTEPRVLLLDEPTKGLDAMSKIGLAALLCDLVAEGIAVVMVSHDVEFCARHADEVSMLFDGDIVTSDTPRRFFAGNAFYTTAANRMSRHVFANAVTDEDVVQLCRF